MNSTCDKYPDQLAERRGGVNSTREGRPLQAFQKYLKLEKRGAVTFVGISHSVQKNGDVKLTGRFSGSRRAFMSVGGACVPLLRHVLTDH